MMPYSQSDQFAGTAMCGNSVVCIDCHDPHANTVADGTGLRVDALCTICHDQIIDIAHQLDTTCKDCHMPKIGKTATSSFTGGLFPVGDLRSHIFKIDSTKTNADRLYMEGGKTYAKRFITLEEACFTCHNNITYQEAIDYIPLIHP